MCYPTWYGKLVQDVVTMVTKRTAIYSTKSLLLTVLSATLQHDYDDPLTTKNQYMFIICMSDLTTMRVSDK